MTYDQIIDKYYARGSRLREILVLHSRCVADMALEIARKRQLNLDPAEIEAAAMLHDIGIVQCDAPGIDCHGSEPYIRHGVLGAEMLRSLGVAEEVASVAERHTGSGLLATEIEARQLPLPHRDLMPRTQLERLICYADKFYSKTRGDQRKTLEHVRASLLKHGQAALERFDKLHDEFNC